MVGGCVGACVLPPKPVDDERPSEGTAVQVSAATLLRGGAEQGEVPGRNPGPPSRDTGERGTALGGGALSQAFREGQPKGCARV